MANENLDYSLWEKFMAILKREKLSRDGGANPKYEKYLEELSRAQDQKNLDEQNAAEARLKEKTKKEYARWLKSQKSLNRGGMTMRKGNMAYSKGGSAKKAKTGSTDYRKGGMVYTTKGK